MPKFGEKVLVVDELELVDGLKLELEGDCGGGGGVIVEDGKSEACEVMERGLIKSGKLLLGEEVDCGFAETENCLRAHVDEEFLELGILTMLRADSASWSDGKAGIVSKEAKVEE